MEGPEVFDATHELSSAPRRGQGYRPADRPSRRALRARILPAVAGGRGAATAAACAGPGPSDSRRSPRTIAPPRQPDGATARPLWIVAEKILVPASRCPTGGPVAGTTGLRLPRLASTASSSTALSRQHRRASTGDSPAADSRHGRRDLRRQAPDHAGLDGERDQRARPPARPHLRAQPPLPRLHAVTPLRDAPRGDRLLPRLSHLLGDDGGRRSRATAAYIEHAVPARPAAQPDRGERVVFDFVRDVLAAPASGRGGSPRSGRERAPLRHALPADRPAR